ncbi:ATP-binding protein [Streptomyces sp. NPDC050856]|uniref:ATP-binding protein n=1 Tax=Streptomyces sp. NPDC050856 TaxID=3154939 RepID=UPI0033D72620
MSLPLSRRIARAALLLAAGAAPVVGAAGSASAVDLPKSPDLGGTLTAPDTAVLGGAVDSASHTAAGARTGTALDKAAPVVNKVGEATAPAAGRAAGDVAGGAGEVVGRTAGAAAGAGATGALGGGLPATGELPVKSPLG